MMRFGLFPRTGPRRELADALSRALWHLAPWLETGQAQLSLADTIEARESLAAPPDFLSPEARAVFFRLAPRMALSTGAPSPQRELVWDASKLNDLSARARRHSLVIDEYTRGDAALVYLRLAYELSLADTQARWVDGRRLADLARAKGAVLVLGPGPLLSNLPELRRGDDVRIVAVSSALWHPRLGADLRPHVVVVADGLAAAGPTRAATELRRVLTEAAGRGALLVTSTAIAASLTRQLPAAAAQNLIGLQFDPSARVDSLRADLRGPAPATTNVLTSLALPVAAALGDDLRLAGFDGPDRNGEARHANDLARLRREMDLRTAHPLCGFPLHSYYAEHQARLTIDEAVLRDGGVSLRALTPTQLKGVDQPAALALPQPPSASRKAFYAVASLVDDRPVTSALLCGSAAGLGSALALFAAPSLRLDESVVLLLICAMVGFASVTVAVGGFLLSRRRTTRLIAEARRDATMQIAELMRYTAARLDEIEKAKLDQDETGSP